MDNDVIEFIKRRFSDTNAHWFDGNCYYFALILCHRFPNLRIYYEPIVGHFYASDSINFYDASGLVTPPYPPISLEEIKDTDDLFYSHLIRDCVM